MTNDICLKGFWPPEAKVTVDFGLEPGLKSFSFFLNDPMFKNHPFILETPKGTDSDGCDFDMINLKILSELI